MKNKIKNFWRVKMDMNKNKLHRLNTEISRLKKIALERKRLQRDEDTIHNRIRMLDKKDDENDEVDSN